MNNLELSKECVNYVLYFTKDSHIKLKNNNKFYQLEEVLKDIDVNKLFIILMSGSIIKLEKGITVGNIINALKPFGELITLHTQSDFNAYYRENNKPSPHSGKEFDFIEIFRDIELYLRPETSKHVMIDNEVYACGKNTSDENNYSIDMPVEMVRNTEIVISNNARVSISIPNNENKQEYLSYRPIDILEITFKELLDIIFFQIFFNESPDSVEEYKDFIDMLNERISSTDVNDEDLIVHDSSEIEPLSVEETKKESDDYLDEVAKNQPLLTSIIKENKIMPNIGKYDFQ